MAKFAGKRGDLTWVMPFIKTVATCVVFSILHETIRQRFSRRIKALEEAHDILVDACVNLADANDSQAEKIRYLVYLLLDVYDAEFDTFDMIALTHDVPE